MVKEQVNLQQECQAAICVKIKMVWYLKRKKLFAFETDSVRIRISLDSSSGFLQVAKFSKGVSFNLESLTFTYPTNDSLLFYHMWPGYGGHYFPPIFQLP